MRTTLMTMLVVLTLAAPAAAAPAIHSHRGGSVLAGVPTFAEETMPAFRHAWERERSVLELDVKLTKDRVPVVIHDDTLDRTTDCEGAVSEKTVAQFLKCRADVLGSGATTAKAAPGVTLPLLTDVLAYAKETGATLNIEIKNLPTDSDYDDTSAYADTVMDAIIASGLPKEQLIVQSFWPANLDAAKAKLPGVALSILTLQAEGGIEIAAARGYEWVSPSGPSNAAFVARAHALGLKVVPYTLNTPDDVKAAADAGVDALITDDPVMARRALGLPEPPAPPTTPSGKPPSSAGTPAARPARITLRAVPRRLGTVRRRGLPVRVSADRPATVSIAVLRGRRVIARRTIAVGPRPRTVTFRLTRAALRGRRVTLRVEAGGPRLRLSLR